MAYCLEPFLIVTDFLEFILSLILRSTLDAIFLFTSPIWYIIEAYQSASTGKKEFNSILITGASSGIGRAVAIEFAQKNPSVTLFLLGRNKERLEETKQLCSQYVTNQQSIYCHAVDNTDKKEMEKIIYKCDDINPIDLVFANAGIGNQQTNSNDWFDRYEQLVNTNIFGTFNTVFPAIKRFIKRKHGHIAFNASIASYQVLFGSTSIYSATKVFIRFMCQTLACSLMYYQIDCTVINLGYVDTNMISGMGKGAKKWSKSAEDTASVIVNGLYRNKSTIHFPWHLSFIMWYVGGLHPVLNNCISWISMPGPREPNHVFSDYLDEENGDGDGKNERRMIHNDDKKEEENDDDDERVLIERDDNKEREKLISDEDK